MSNSETKLNFNQKLKEFYFTRLHFINYLDIASHMPSDISGLKKPKEELIQYTQVCEEFLKYSAAIVKDGPIDKKEYDRALNNFHINIGKKLKESDEIYKVFFKEYAFFNSMIGGVILFFENIHEVSKDVSYISKSKHLMNYQLFKLGKKNRDTDIYVDALVFYPIIGPDGKYRLMNYSRENHSTEYIFVYNTDKVFHQTPGAGFLPLKCGSVEEMKKTIEEGKPRFKYYHHLFDANGKLIGNGGDFYSRVSFKKIGFNESSNDNEFTEAYMCDFPYSLLPENS